MTGISHLETMEEGEGILALQQFFIGRLLCTEMMCCSRPIAAAAAVVSGGGGGVGGGGGGGGIGGSSGGGGSDAKMRSDRLLPEVCQSFDGLRKWE